MRLLSVDEGEGRRGSTYEKVEWVGVVVEV